MKIILTALLVSLVSGAASAQGELQKQASAIMAEGKKLYRSEMASWYGTDIFLERFPAQKEKFSGYFSYNDGNLARCVFFSKDAVPNVLATITFDSTYNLSAAVADGTERAFTPLEEKLHGLRKAAVAQIKSDTLFKQYKNTTFNLVPIVDGAERKVYVLTGTSQSGVVMFGNDYLLTYDQNTVLINEKRLHKSLIPISYGNEKSGEIKEVLGTMHTHLPELGELMTPTDICTLMLYQKLTNWNQHIVISAHYVSIWDCHQQQLLALTTEAWKKMSQK